MTVPSCFPPRPREHGALPRRPRAPQVRWLLPTLVAACALGVPGTASAAGAGLGSVQTFATRLTNDVTALAASVAVLFLAINGVRWTMSSGNPMRQAEARSGLVAAATGLAIALSANVIVAVLLAALR